MCWTHAKKNNFSNKQDGKSIGGRGRLTDNAIEKLQVYYGRAIRGNSASITDMKDTVMAI